MSHVVNIELIPKQALRPTSFPKSWSMTHLVPCTITSFHNACLLHHCCTSNLAHFSLSLVLSCWTVSASGPFCASSAHNIYQSRVSNVRRNNRQHFGYISLEHIDTFA